MVLLVPVVLETDQGTLRPLTPILNIVIVILHGVIISLLDVRPHKEVAQGMVVSIHLDSQHPIVARIVRGDSQPDQAGLQGMMADNYPLISLQVSVHLREDRHPRTDAHPW